MKFLDWLNTNGTVPNLLLGLLMLLGFVVLVSAVRMRNFRLGDMLIDERGKASSSRLSMFIALGLSSYMLAYITINNTVDDNTLLYVYAVYLLTWASSKTLDKLVSSWSFSKGYGGPTDHLSQQRRDERNDGPIPRYEPRYDPRDRGSHEPQPAPDPADPVDYMRRPDARR